MSARRLLILGLFLSVIVGVAGAAHAQSINAETPSCLPREQNGIIRATTDGTTAGQPLRLYFRWEELQDFYWVPMEMESGGRYWAIPPKPERRNAEVEYYAARMDSAGKIADRSETRKVKVDGDCQVRLTPKERGVAENLTVGETKSEQQGKKVMGFLCDGVVTRINAEGIRRSDEICRACVVAFWPRVVSPMAAAGVLGVVITDEPEPSPSRPRN